MHTFVCVGCGKEYHRCPSCNGEDSWDAMARRIDYCSYDCMWCSTMPLNPKDAELVNKLGAFFEDRFHRLESVSRNLPHWESARGFLLAHEWGYTVPTVFITKDRLPKLMWAQGESIATLTFGSC